MPSYTKTEIRLKKVFFYIMRSSGGRFWLSTDPLEDFFLISLHSFDGKHTNVAVWLKKNTVTRAQILVNDGLCDLTIDPDQYRCGGELRGIQKW